MGREGSANLTWAMQKLRCAFASIILHALFLCLVAQAVFVVESIGTGTSQHGFLHSGADIQAFKLQNNMCQQHHVDGYTMKKDALPTPDSH